MIKYFTDIQWFDTPYINLKLTLLNLLLLFLDKTSTPPLLPLICQRLPGNESQNWCILHATFFTGCLWKS